MATYIVFRRMHGVANYFSISHAQRLTRICNRCRNVYTTAALRADASEQGSDLKRDAELSWVRKMLYGSGPSAEIEELEEEEDVVGVTPRYMEIMQDRPSFIEKPEVRKRVYRPPQDLSDLLRDITVKVCPNTTPDDWLQMSITDNEVKYQILSKCSETLKHDIPNFMLNQMKMMSDVLAFYQVEVKDTSKFDELSAQDLPENLRIHWDYKDDSKLEIYQDYLDYVRPKFQVKSKDIPDWRYR